MNRKKIGICLAVIIWFACSTKIITGLYNRNVEITKNVNIPYLEMPIGYNCVDEFYCTNNIFSSINISGWAVYPDASGGEKTYLYLESPNNKYKIGMLPQYRNDFLTIVRQWGISVEGDDHGFTAEICPYFIKSGEYNIYILSQLGDDIVGMSKTNYILEKDMKGCSVEKEKTYLVDKIEKTEKVDMQHWIDYLKVEEGTLKIGGWLLFPGTANTYRESYIGIIDENGMEKFYKAVTSSRLDLLSMAREHNCKDAGFEVEIPLEELGNIKNSYLNFYVKSNGKFHKAADGLNITIP